MTVKAARAAAAAEASETGFQTQAQAGRPQPTAAGLLAGPDPGRLVGVAVGRRQVTPSHESDWHESL